MEEAKAAADETESKLRKELKKAGKTKAKAEDAETDCDEPEPEQNLATIASGLANAQGDFFFGDGEVNEMCLDYDDLDVAPDYTLPTEAFEPRHELADGSPPPESLQVGLTTYTDWTTWSSGSQTGPLAARLEEGTGQVIYTSFHNESQATVDMDVLLQEIILSL